MISLLLMFFPNGVRLFVYRRIFGYKIGRDVRIGFSWICVKKLTIGDHVRIGHFSRFKNIPELVIGSYCTIGNGNHFTTSPEFSDPKGRALRGNHPRLVIGDHCGISNSHYFDVQDEFEIGAFTTIAGVRSVFFTHQIDIAKSEQSAKPIRIGSYCMVGSNVSLTPGTRLSDYSVVGMGAVVSGTFEERHVLIAGSPAVVKKKLAAESAYFHRPMGFISTVLPPPFK